MNLCEYGCGKEAKHQFKNGKWCCEYSKNKCKAQKEKISKSNKGKKRSEETIKKLKDARKNVTIETRNKMSESHKGKKQKEETKIKISKSLKKSYTKERKEKLRKQATGRKHTKETIKKMKKRCRNKKVRRQLSMSAKLTISKIKKKYPLFYMVEGMRYNPDKPGEKEIQVHCKNHNCPNSKENDGWFTPSREQFKLRKSWIEREGVDNCYFYCSENCKKTCPLYGLNPNYVINENLDVPYTQEEYNQWKITVLERDGYKCQYCGREENLHCHHIIPVKINPMLALDPDNGITFCNIHHYEIGHKTNTECSTGNLANKICI